MSQTRWRVGLTDDNLHDVDADYWTISQSGLCFYEYPQEPVAAYATGTWRYVEAADVKRQGR